MEIGWAAPMLDSSAEVDQAYKLLTLANSAIVVTEREKPIGVIARQDIISFLSMTS